MLCSNPIITNTVTQNSKTNRSVTFLLSNLYTAKYTSTPQKIERRKILNRVSLNFAEAISSAVSNKTLILENLKINVIRNVPNTFPNKVTTSFTVTSNNDGFVLLFGS